MTRVCITVDAIAFLPYCQLTSASVTADIFTSWASPRCSAGFSLLAAIIALAFRLLLLWRMTLGLLDQKAYGYTTAILQFPHWVAFVPILISLALLAFAAGITLVESFRQAKACAHDGPAADRPCRPRRPGPADRKSVVEGTQVAVRVNLGGSR